MAEARAAYAEKQAIIDEIKAKLEDAQSAVIIDYIGTSVEEANEMRKMLRDEDVDYTVYKNTLMKRAFDGTDYEELNQVLTGPSAIAISKTDATAPARVLQKAIKKMNKMAFKGGIVEGSYYDAEGLTALAKIPSRDELIAKFMGSIQSPISAAVRTFAAIRDAKAEGVPADAASEEKPAEEAAPAVEQPTEQAETQDKPAE